MADLYKNTFPLRLLRNCCCVAGLADESGVGVKVIRICIGSRSLVAGPSPMNARKWPLVIRSPRHRAGNILTDGFSRDLETGDQTQTGLESGVQS